MVDVSDSKLKQMVSKPWSVWSLPGCSTEFDSVKLKNAYKPKEPDKPIDHCNLLPASLMQLYGTKPDIEYFSVTKCSGCKNVMKSQWMSQHFKRDGMNNMVCRKTEMIVAGVKCLGKATPPLHELRESTRNPLLEFTNASNSMSTTKFPYSHPLDNVISPTISPSRSKSSSYKTEHVSSSSSKSKSGSSHSQFKKHSSSSSTNSTSASSSSTKSKSISKSSSASSLLWSSSKKESSSKSSHKSNTPTASYVLSIPSDDSGQNDTVESILSNSHSSSTKQTMHIITMSSASGKKSGEAEYEQLKFYADSSEKRSKASNAFSETSDSGKRGHNLYHQSSSSSHTLDCSTFKIPLKNRPSTITSSSGSGSISSSDTRNQKSKSSHSHHSKSSHDSGKVVFRSSSSSSSSTKISHFSSSISSSSEAKEKGSSSTSQSSSDSKEKSSSSHSKKKKKKKDKDEPRKVIPLKDRAFHPDQHCGVIVPEELHPCTRSLTCKTHSIALRRAVQGRSHPFDSLLAAHKKARDEEKNSKAKDHGEESKLKSKKSSSQSSTGPDIIISPVHSLGLVKEVTSGITPTKGHGSFTTSTSVPPTVLSAQSSNGKNVNSSSTEVTKRASSFLPAPVPAQRQLSKINSTTKSSNKPVIVVEERKEAPGLSFFDVVKEPENSFLFVTSIQSSKYLQDIKESIKSSRNISALSEWNTLDRWTSPKGKFVKKKGFKDPIVKFTPRKDDLQLKKSGSNDANEESSNSSQPAKKRRLLKQPKLLYQSLLFNAPSKESTQINGAQLGESGGESGGESQIYIPPH